MSLTVEKCLKAWTNSLRYMNAKADIVFFGDSLTYYGDFSSVFPDKVVCNLGLSGDTIQGMIDRVEQVKMLKPKMVFLMAGINDIANNTIAEFGKRYNTLIDTLLTIAPDVELILQSMLPVNDRDYAISCTNKQILDRNAIIQDLAVQYNLGFIDLFRLYGGEGYLPINITSDGIHLIPEAYKEWYTLLKNNIVE